MDSVDLEDSPLRTDQDTQDERRMRYFTTTKSIINGFGQASTNLSPLPIFWRSDQQISSVHAAPSLGPIEVTLTDREKRCLAVPIDDVRDKKPRLLRCRSAVTLPKSNDSEKQLLGRNQSSLQAGIRIPQMTSPASVGLLDSSFLKMSTNPLMPTTDVTADKHNNLVRESYCQTPKEKECWHLYRRMCDKGVFVSFDTVLRGMLTPTEYRLRQKEMSQNCLQS